MAAGKHTAAAVRGGGQTGTAHCVGGGGLGVLLGAKHCQTAVPGELAVAVAVSPGGFLVVWH
jgi:hypothetical protein